jgi:hypothetical protein
MFSAHLQSRARNRRRIMYVGFVLALCCALAAVGSWRGVSFRYMAFCDRISNSQVVLRSGCRYFIGFIGLHILHTNEDAYGC